MGYIIPFEMFAAPWINAGVLTKRLNALDVPGVIFRPIYAKPFYATFKGENIEGVQAHIIDYNKAPLTDIQFLVMQEVAAMYPEKAVFEVADHKRFGMFDNVCGTSKIRELFSKRNRWEYVKDYLYNPDLEHRRSNNTDSCHRYFQRNNYCRNDFGKQSWVLGTHIYTT